MFKVGDKVWDFRLGWGVITEIDEKEENYPVYADFDSRLNYYTKDGKDGGLTNRTLFFEEISVPKSALVKKKWRADKEGKYYFVGMTGEVMPTKDECDNNDDKLWSIGNYFQTIEEAKESKLYKVFEEMK